MLVGAQWPGGLPSRVSEWQLATRVSRPGKGLHSSGIGQPLACAFCTTREPHGPPTMGTWSGCLLPSLPSAWLGSPGPLEARVVLRLEQVHLEPGQARGLERSWEERACTPQASVQHPEQPAHGCPARYPKWLGCSHAAPVRSHLQVLYTCCSFCWHSLSLFLLLS